MPIIQIVTLTLCLVAVGKSEVPPAMTFQGSSASAPKAVEDPRYSLHTAARKPGTNVRIDLIGDSTQTDNGGYGRGFCANLTAHVDCVNMAKGGASTRTYQQDGLWDLSLGTQPDYMLIQFGHNDMVSAEHLPRQVSIDVYEQNLHNFVNEARAHGIMVADDVIRSEVELGPNVIGAAKVSAASRGN